MATLSDFYCRVCKEHVRQEACPWCGGAACRVCLAWLSPCPRYGDKSCQALHGYQASNQTAEKAPR